MWILRARGMSDNLYLNFFSHYCINSITIVTILLKYGHSFITYVALKMVYANAETGFSNLKMLFLYLELL